MRSIAIFFGLALRNVLRNKRRTLLTLLAVAAGIWSSVTLAALARGVSTQMADDAILELVGHIQLHAEGYLDDPVAQRSVAPPHDRLRAEIESPLVAGFANRVRVPGMISSERESAGIEIIGIEPTEEKISFLPGALSSGSLPSAGDDDGIVIGAKLAEQLVTSLGKRVVITAQNSEDRISDRGFRIRGLFEAELESSEKRYVFISRQRAQQFFGMGNSTSEISVLMKDRSRIDEGVERLRAAAPELDVRSWNDVRPLAAALTSVQDGFLRFWFLIVVVAVAFGLVNTLFMAIFERIREIGLMQALGVSPSMIMLEVIFESVIIIAVGIVLGNLVALVTVDLLRDGIDISSFARGAQIAGIRNVIRPVLLQQDQVLANVLLAVLGILSCAYPAWRASRYTPVQALGKT